jgi:ABC-type nickel/cobalt efflux system permease component RcnA
MSHVTPLWSRRSRFALGLLLALLLLRLVPTSPAAAHPLGNFTVNQYSRIEIGRDAARLFYVLDLAELPTVADRPALDVNGDGAIAASERERYLDAKLAEITPALHLVLGSRELPLQLVDRTLAFTPGQAGLDTTRIEATFSAPLPVSERGQLGYRNDYATDRLGWREIVATNGDGIRLDNGEALAVDRSHALRAYPADLLASPPDERSTSIAFQVVPGASATGGMIVANPPGPFGLAERLASVVNGSVASTTGTLLALLAAAAWGALHALSPGHGKTVVGAYLVGSRGTPLHALFLGLTVTITHTAGVIALGLAILFASRAIVPEQIYPWLSLLFGLLVVALGLVILRQRLAGVPSLGHHHHAHVHDHAHSHEELHALGIAHAHEGHGHDHLPPGARGEPVTWRGLLALGISGGLLPCPSALLALLGAVAIGRAGFGLLVVIAFSLGLAATLTGVGLLFLHAGRYLERRAACRPAPGLLRFAPAAAALVVTFSGVMLVARAVVELRWV